jgi:uncharacterized protein
MQGRMKEHPLLPDEITTLLLTEPVGNLGTVSDNGFPYITPVHFVVIEEKIYIHGLRAGQKIDYLKKNSKVGFEVFRLNGLIHDPELPCDTNTDYQSVILTGIAKLIDDEVLKINVLDEVVKKYTPQHIGKSYPAAMLKSTGVIEITVSEITGKYFK